MKLSQLNRLNRLMAVQSMLEDHRDVWESNAAITGPAAQLSFVIAQLREQMATQAATTKGVTQDKQSVKEELSAQLFALCGALHTIGEELDSSELTAPAQHSESGLRVMAGGRLLAYAESLLALTDPYVDELMDAGWDPTRMDALRDLVESFAGRLPAPRKAISHRTAATSDIEALLRKGGRLLRYKLTRSMVQYRSISPSFYKAFKAANVLVDLAGTTGKDADAETPLAA
jgi:hypothetical protein